ncbi:MAG: lactate permease LctP family transporter [Acidobacteria bacterium]|nr:lactate permease LctP family transporter [Acidobacteriota bacterium]
MWPHNYTPLADSLALSSLVAALPIFVLLVMIGILRKPAWMAALSGLAGALIVALFVYGMPAATVAAAVTYGACFGLFPIGWIVYWAIVLYRITVETGNFEIIKDSIGGLTEDRRLQAMLIAFALGAFIEGAAGFGTPVAVAAAMLTGLGFSPFYAAAICLLANTAPVAFGSIGIPVVTLAGITGLPMNELSAWVGRICAPVSVFVPAYLVMVMGGFRALRGVIPAAALCGIAFAGMQFYVSNYIGPQLTDILAALAAIVTMVVLLKVWKPKDTFHLAEETSPQLKPEPHSLGRTILAWSPYLFLVFFVLLWGQKPVQDILNTVTTKFPWPGLHNLVQRVPPVVANPAPYAAEYTFNFLSAAGSACMFATLASMLVLRVGIGKYVGILFAVGKQLFLSMVTIASVLGLAFLMNYCGATSTLGLAFAATGVAFPFFSAMLGWLGVFLTGSDTSANALFGNLQVVTANRLGLDPVLMASANSAGGVMGKMISLQSIAVAAAATSMKAADEARLFRFTMRHSIFLASVLGVITFIYATMQK